MKINTLLLLFFPILIWLDSCYNRVSHLNKQDGGANGITIVNQKWVINNRIDLRGEDIILPDSTDLVIGESGFLCNGTITGSNTRIVGKEYHVFDDIKIKGSWIVPLINSDLFTTISNNTINNLFNLASPSMANTVYIGEGVYPIEIDSNTFDGIIVPSNTEVILNGTIRCKPNSLKEYHILHLLGDSIIIHGRGQIIGDRENHLGVEGEWGHGIFVSKAGNVVISDISVRDCWGDCIYIGKNSKNIVVNNCSLSNSRRQGISITSVDTVKILNTIISNVGGTPPEYGIDVEPNSSESVNYVKLYNVTVIDCKGGFESTGKAKNAHIGTIMINNCKVIGQSRFYPFMFRNQDSLIMEDCYAFTTNNRNVEIRIEGIKHGKIQNTFTNSKNDPYIIKDSPNIIISSN